MKHIVCCIPLSWDFVPRDFFFSFIAMKEYAEKHPDYALSYVSVKHIYMDATRDMLAKEALEMEPKPYALLWLDADQTYPEDTPERLLRHIENGYTVVGGVTPQRSSGLPMVYEFGQDGRVTLVDDFKLNRGLVQVDAMGFGGVMTSTRVFDAIPNPRFIFSWDKDRKYYFREDVVFYQNCRAYDFNVFCDTDLHFGHLAYRDIREFQDLG